MTFVKSLVLFLILGLLVINTTAGNAQVPGAGMPPQFVPVGGWNVEPTALSQARGLSGIKLPCMMVANYDNGYIVRLSGGGQNLLAMAIDFRQSVFHQGRKYQATVTIDGGFSQKVTATAFSQSVLIFNLRELNGFYGAVQNAGSMALTIEGNTMNFTLGSVSAGLSALEACYNPDAAPKIQEAATTDVPDEGGVPRGPMDSWQEEVTPMPAEALKAPKANKFPGTQLWEARAGDDLKQTLQGWAARAGVDLAWQADQGGTVSDDIRVSGTFEDAVQTLMARNAAALGLEANMHNGGNSAMPISAGVLHGAPQRIVPPASMAGNGGAKWYAPAGASLQEVLAGWAAQAGVELIWESNQGFATKRAVNANGDYESALQSLLNQYSNDKVRPAAQLNNDPVTGQRVLIVQSTRVL